MVTWENYEEYMCLHTDGELSEADTRALFAFVHQHPELQDELKLFEATRMAPDTTVVFTSKKALMKPAGMTISLGNWKAYSAAAGLLLLVAIGAMKWMNNDGETAEGTNVAVNTPPVKEEPANVTPIDTEKAEVVAPVVETPETPVKAMPQHIAQKPVRTPQRVPETAPQQTIKTYELAVIQPIKKETLPQNNISTPELIAKAEPGTNINIEQKEEKKDVLAWLPVDDEKKAGMKTLANGIASKVEKVKTIRENIKETTLAVRIAGKELVINF